MGATGKAGVWLGGGPSAELGSERGLGRDVGGGVASGWEAERVEVPETPHLQGER